MEINGNKQNKRCRRRRENLEHDVSERLFPLKINSFCNWNWFFVACGGLFLKLTEIRSQCHVNTAEILPHEFLISIDNTAWKECHLLTWGGLHILKLMEIRRTEGYFWKVVTLISIRTRARAIRQHEIWWQTQGEGDPARVSWTLFEMWCLKLGNVPKPSYRWCNNGNRAVGAGKSWKTGFWRRSTKDMDTPPGWGGVSRN